MSLYAVCACGRTCSTFWSPSFRDVPSCPSSCCNYAACILYTLMLSLYARLFTSNDPLAIRAPFLRTFLRKKKEPVSRSFLNIAHAVPYVNPVLFPVTPYLFQPVPHSRYGRLCFPYLSPTVLPRILFFSGRWIILPNSKQTLYSTGENAWNLRFF